MKDLLERLFSRNRYLLGEDYDWSLQEIDANLPLEILEVPTGTVVGDWTVPEEWIMRDGWVKFNGEKIIDYKEVPLSVMVGSCAVHKTVKRTELMDHLHISDERPDAYPFAYNFYEKDWGFTYPKSKVKKEVEPGKWEDLMEEGDYEVFIDAEHRPGTMKIGVHTIKGTSDREILIFAHLDHPYQANDNLSGVVCLVDLAKSLEEAKFEHTIKLIFCPETIGGIAYATLKDISKVDFVVAVDSVGSEGSMLIQKTFEKESRLNKIMHLAHSGQAIDYRKADFRLLAGGEEYLFNDPRINIPGIFISRIGDEFDHYHTADDTPEKINYEKIREAEKAILKLIEIYEQDFIPERTLTGPLFRTKYKVQSPHKHVNLALDYMWYGIDGKKWLSEIVINTGISFETAYLAANNLLNGGAITKKNSGDIGAKGKVRKTSKKGV